MRVWVNSPKWHTALYLQAHDAWLRRLRGQLCVPIIGSDAYAKRMSYAAADIFLISSIFLPKVVASELERATA